MWIERGRLVVVSGRAHRSTSGRGVLFRSGLVAVLPRVLNDVITRQQVLLNGSVEKSRVAVVYMEFEDDRATHLRYTSYVSRWFDKFHGGVGESDSHYPPAVFRHVGTPPRLKAWFSALQFL